jgi:hypothetical protein
MPPGKRCECLASHRQPGDGLDLVGRIEESRFRPGKKLMDHVAVRRTAAVGRA